MNSSALFYSLYRIYQYRQPRFLSNLLMALLCFSVTIFSVNSLALDKVRLQLKFKHQFQFAGYYAALAQGYYADAGLDVEIVAGVDGNAPIQEVLSGRAQFGIGSNSLLLAHSKQQPVVALGVIFQHSPQVLVMPKRAGLESIHSIIGKKAMIFAQADELTAYLYKESIPLDQITFVEHSFNIDDLIQGKVDAFSVYSTNEPSYLNEQGFSYSLFSPRSAGIDFYGDNLFTSEQQIAENPERVAAFTQASMRGWRYAFEHPEEIIALILAQYSTRKSAEHLRFEYQQMIPLVQPTFVEIGYMNPGRWRHIADTYAELGMLPKNYQFNGFLYKITPPVDRFWWYVSVIFLVFLLLLISLLHYRNRAKERLVAKQQIELQNSLLYAQQDASLEGLLAIDIDNRILSANQRYLDLWHVDREVIDQADNHILLQIVMKKLVEPDVFLQRVEEITKQFDLVTTDEWELKDGRIIERYTTPLTSKTGQYFGRLWSFRDITEQKKANKAVWKQANLDFLTGLPNRYFFLKKLKKAMDNAQQEQTKLAVLFLDLDRFKEVNDTLGHDVGDKLIQEVAQRILSNTPEKGTIARLGGDEFTMIIEHITCLESIDGIVNELLQQLSEPFTFADEIVQISASIGITIYPDDGSDETTLVKNADQAMYAAKDSGRNKYQLFNAKMQEEAVIRSTLISALRGALAQDQFSLYYQPIVRLADNTIVKAEALLRWQHPEFAMVSPDQFIPLAEETGMITDIGNWVFETASEKLQYWRAQFKDDMKLSINVSPAQFTVNTLMNAWQQQLAQRNIPGDALIIEITENLLMHPSDQVSNTLLQFSNGGINVALDDFGTGYSSLSYLNRFDIDYLKIDKVFVWNLQSSANDLALCEAIIVMAHKLGVKVIAEGIETADQLRILKEIGCDYGQGFYLAKPLPEDEFEKLLSENSQ